MAFESITSRKNRRIISVCALSDKKERDGRGLFCAEGTKLISELISENIMIRELYFTERAAEKYNGQISVCDGRGAECFLVTDEVYEKLTEEKNPEGILAVAEKPEVFSDISETSGEGGFLVLDGVQNPLNAGTVIRTASALGFSRILFGPGCADIFSRKALRASMGTVFKVNICLSRDLCADISRLKELGLVYAAALEPDSIDIRKTTFKKNDSFVLGNEGQGISPAILSLCDKKIIIPMQQNTESLNAATAAAIIMWEMKKEYLS